MPGPSPNAATGSIRSCAGKVEEKILDRAGEQTVTELKRSLTRAVKAVDPRGWAERHQQAKKRRDVYPSLQPDGMAALSSTHTAGDVEAMMAVLQRVADRDRGDGRLVGERRADALRDWSSAGSRPPHRQAGQAPADHHRRRLRYEPCPALREKVIRRDRTCRFPGCNRQAINCEIDHIVPYNGPTPSRPTCTRLPSPPPRQDRGRLAVRDLTTAPPNGRARPAGSSSNPHPNPTTTNHPDHQPQGPGRPLVDFSGARRAELQARSSTPADAPVRRFVLVHISRRSLADAIPASRHPHSAP